MAVAVAEPGTQLEWRGSEVRQVKGDVFYRVEPGGPFVVKTDAGDIAVLGTCFRVRLGRAAREEDMFRRRDVALTGAGAALAALAVVTVYEGKVRLSRAAENVTLSAGQSGRLGPDGVRRSETKSGRADTGEDGGGVARLWNGANERLEGDVGRLRQRLAELEAQKARLQADLAAAEREVAALGDGGAPRNRHEFDLDERDWAEIARTGTIKYRQPCLARDGWRPGPHQLEALGLAPEDTDALAEAYRRSYERVWGTLRPLCARAVGNADVVEAFGPDVCAHVVLHVARKQDSEAARAAMQQVAEVRAGLRPAPAPGAERHPVFEVFWTLTGEMKSFEADLAESFGPDEARRLAYSDALCASHSTFGDSEPRRQ